METPATTDDVDISSDSLKPEPSEQEEQEVLEQEVLEEEKERRAEKTEAVSNEDPDAVRRAQRRIDREDARRVAEQASVEAIEDPDKTTPPEETAVAGEAGEAQRDIVEEEAAPEKGAWDYDIYGSLRLHAIQHYDAVEDETSTELGDGASRIGGSISWLVNENWDIFGRYELGFDILDSFTPKAQGDSSGKLEDRLAYVGLESDFLYLRLGKSYSAYYTVAGDADRFTIFGGNASGIYNAGTDGGQTGTGRADEAIQSRVYLDPHDLLNLKPFNVNLQYQPSQPIPHVRGQDYLHSWSASAWLENDWEVGIGLALHRSTIDNPEAPEVKAAGIDGDATAAAIALRSYGETWLASLVLVEHDNVETTNEKRYINGNGAELFVQWQFRQNIWLIGGGNWLITDEDDPDAGEFATKYGVLGMRYTFDSFNRMIYFEWRNDHGTLASGAERDDEVTIGFRWDFNY